MTDDLNERSNDRLDWDAKYRGRALEESISRVEQVDSLKIGRELNALIPSDGAVLEAGSGTGRILNYVAWKTGADGIGIDYSLEGNQLGRLVSREMGLSNLFVMGDLRAMPFSEDAFDVVFSDSVIEHLEETEQAIGEMARVTKSGGLVIITTPNKLRPDGWDLYKRKNVVPYLQKSFMPRELRRMFDSNGLAIERFFGDTLLLLRNFVRSRHKYDLQTTKSSSDPTQGKGRIQRLEKGLEGVWPARWWINLGVVGRKH